LLPTTTIGSFPQTNAIRNKRRAFHRQLISKEEYDAFLRTEIRRVIERQNDLGLDVLVHGEAERSDLVEYFGQHLKGFCFTENGWVQSYGSRCVKPPIVYGDVSRPSPITVEWMIYARSLTERPLKGILAGPVTMTSWSFLRDDLPRVDICRQIALAVRDEVADLEAAGIPIIQINEEALSEGMPINLFEGPAYLRWAVDAFRLATSVVQDETQIHTHMCYSELNSIIHSIIEMDADVISIESSRSKMKILDVFKEIEYPNEIGPGVYDVHSSHVPSKREFIEKLERELRHIPMLR
jgi:5-methyltetrahydropteroyltriglutamate--homocysteine methyltransferase